jgi:hypothetical protein
VSSGTAAGTPSRGVERPGGGHRHAGEDRGLPLRVLARLGRAQLVDEVEEHPGVIALEGDDELLVVEP